MFLQYWLALFTTSATANMIGLNISSAFNSAITIYIVVPLLMIPMMVLSGAMFPFDKLNRSLGGIDKVPAIADIMPTKWTYEALMVSQFKDNEYGKLYYDTQQQIKNAEFNIDYRLDDLKDSLSRTVQAYRHKELSEEHPSSLRLIRNELEKIARELDIEEFGKLDELTYDKFNHIVAESADNYIDDVISRYRVISDAADLKWDSFYTANRELLDDMYDDYHNQKLEEIVRKIAEPNKILEYKDYFIQNVEPIYLDPVGNHFPAFRSHFLAPTKVLFGARIDTFTFNIMAVWILTVVFYLLLYFDVLRKIVQLVISN
jgi:hypothetical protein